MTPNILPNVNLEVGYARIAASATVLLILVIGILRVLDPSATVSWARGAAWTALVCCVAFRVFDRREICPLERWAGIGALAGAAGLIVRFGAYDCWNSFETLCVGISDSRLISWSLVYVNQDTFNHLTPPTANSLRPPLYYYMARLISLDVPFDKVLQEAKVLIYFESAEKTKHLIDLLATGSISYLLRIAHFQQLLTLTSVLIFSFVATRRAAGLFVICVVLVLYDGGVLNHWYFSRAIESKFLYISFFFLAAAALAATLVRPTIATVLAVAGFSAAMGLTRPQGMIAGLLVLLACVRYWSATWSSDRKRGAYLTVAAFAAFGLAVFAPSIVTLIGTRVLQPSNIYGLSRIPFALEVALPEDVDLLTSDFRRKYFIEMIAMRDSGERPSAMAASVHRNQGIAMSACDKTGRIELAQKPDAFKLNIRRLGSICADDMMEIANAIFRRRYSDYLDRIVFPNMKSLSLTSIGGAAALGLPVSSIVAVLLIGALAVLAPWVAAFGAAIAIMHVAFTVILAMMVGPHSGYFITSEPVFLCALALMAGTLLVRMRKIADARGWNGNV